MLASGCAGPSKSLCCNSYGGGAVLSMCLRCPVRQGQKLILTHNFTQVADPMPRRLKSTFLGVSHSK